MRFGEFELDLAAGEIRRGGTRVKLQELPFRLLVELASRSGEVVSREELRTKLWGAETFVDAEAGLNTAIAKVREALGDRAEAPIYIATMPKRGYRFLVEIDAAGNRETSAWRRRGVVALLAAVLVILAGTGLWLWRLTRNSRVPIAVVLFHNETGDAVLDPLAQRLTDSTVVALAKEPRLAVIGNAPILRTSRIFTDAQKIGAALHVRYVLVAQLQRPAAGLTVRLHFIRTADQTHLWATSLVGSPASLEVLVPETVLKRVRESVLAPRRNEG